MLNHQSTIDVCKYARPSRTHNPNPLMNPSDYVILDGNKSCTHKELFPSFQRATEHHHVVTLAKTLGLYRAKILADTGDQSLITKANRMGNCSNYVAVRPNGSVITTRCHRRGCPICDTHKSWSLGSKVRRVMNRTNPHNMVCYLLTISTGSNVYAHELKDHCTLLSKSFRRFMNYVAIKRDSNIIGTTRSTEVTYKPNTGYNPHCHVVLWCDGELEVGDSRSYADSVFKLEKLWRKALKYPSDKHLITDFEPIIPLTDKYPEDKTLTDALVRTIRYNTKGFKISDDTGQPNEIAYSPETTLTISNALKNLRLVSHTGWIKKQIAEQSEVDKIISEQRAMNEEAFRGQLKDTRQLVDPDLLHFIWDHKTYQYVDRDEYENRCRYDRPSPDQHFIPYHDYGDTCADSPMNSNELDKSRQLFISNNKTVNDHPLVELVE